MTSILCLAHYCDKHGPTPLMVTEGRPVPCSTCFEEDFSSQSSGSTSRTQSSDVITEALQQVDVDGMQRRASVPTSQSDANAHRAARLRTAQSLAPANGAAVDVDTPPLSPRLPMQVASNAKAPTKSRLDSGFHKTYDDSATRRAGPCENCALTLPKRHKAGEEVDKDAATASQQPESGPTLRSRLPCAKIYSSERLPSTASQSSSSAVSDDESPTGRKSHHHRSGIAVSSNSQSSNNSSRRGSAHVHYLDYTSTHEPLAPSSFFVVRASCLRTLSFEVLPKTPVGATLGSFGTSTPGSISPSVPGFNATHSVGSTASGGPIFFGDANAGYTTAYIFRIPDLHARGHKRVYAFLALNTHRERQAMKTFGFVAGAFRDMAAWIQSLAEAEAERAAAVAGARDDPVGRPFSSTATSPSTIPLAFGCGGLSGAGSRAQMLPDAHVGNGNNMMGVGGSSFLNSSRRAMTAGLGSGGVTVKHRGLAELVGRPDIFLELHTRFVQLFLEIGVNLPT